MLRDFRALALASVCALAACAASAQTVLPDNPDWAEANVPPPPAFRMNKLVEVELEVKGNLRYGVDPATLSIGKDGVVRYVMVAYSPGGAMTAMYEGIRCGTGEFRTYARFNAGEWAPVQPSLWRSLFEPMRFRYPLAIAKQGACDNTAPASNVDAIVRKLRDPTPSERIP